MKRVPIKPGMVFVCRSKTTRTATRRVIAVLPDSTIVYSAGGNQTRSCKRRMFRLWIRRYDAIATRTRRARVMVLRR